MHEPVVMLQLNFFSKKPFKVKVARNGIFMMPVDDLNHREIEIKASQIQAIRWVVNITYELEIETTEKTFVASIGKTRDCYDLYQKIHRYFPDKCNW